MKDSSKTIQVDFELFMLMSAYITSHVDPYNSDLRTILDGIRTKLAAIEKRDTFTAFKTGKAPDECSEYRQAYQELMSRIDLINLP